MNVLDWDSSNKHNKYMADNPFLVRTPSTAVVDMQGYCARSSSSYVGCHADVSWRNGWTDQVVAW